MEFKKDERREFSTGAVRDSVTGKGDMISLPWEAILRLSNAGRSITGVGTTRKVFRYRRLSTAPVGTWQSISAVLTMKIILPPLHSTCSARCLWKTQSRKCRTCR